VEKSSPKRRPPEERRARHPDDISLPNKGSPVPMISPQPIEKDKY
jgi:hypothetical protein